MKLILYTLILLLSVSVSVTAQDLKTVKVDNLSDEQIRQLVKRAEASGMNQQELEVLAASKGMPAIELQKLKLRLQNLDLPASTSAEKLDISRQRAISEGGPEAIEPLIDDKDEMGKAFDVIAQGKKTGDALEKKQFGYYLFNSKNLTFEPSLNMPTPRNYQLGPGDEIIIDIWGASQQSYKLTISPEGSIYIDNVGPVFVSGLSIEKASKQIIGRLTSIYSGLSGSRPNTFAQVNLGNLRSIRVNIVGEVRMPGSYTLPSLSSLFNALYACGGPSVNGSLRDISVYRDNKQIAQIDVYDFLLKGDQLQNIRLQDQDIIMVKPYKIKVELSGEVKNEAYFEMKDNESLANLIDFAGGFTDKAYTNRIKIVRNTDKEQSVADIVKEALDTFKLQNGDIVKVERLLERFANRVEISGAVFRPGQYQLTDGLTAKRLIEQADGLRGDAFMTRAIIYRIREDFTTEALSVDLAALMQGSSQDVLLKKDDVIKIFSIFELQENFSLRIDGEVLKPGEYPYIKNFTLSDLIAMAGGLKESASQSRITIARRVKNSDITSLSATIADHYEFGISKELLLSDSASQFLIEPFDRVFVRRSPGYEVQTLVSIRGEALYPGSYVILRKNERISDLIQRVGGLTKEAYAKGAKLTRKLPVNLEERKKILRAIQSESNDSLRFQVSSETEQSIGIDLVKILENPGSKFDLLLQEGDVLEIPKEIQTVRLSGAFLYPITVRYEKGIGLKRYAAQAGGFAEDAKKSRAFVIYANGSVDKTSNFLWMRFYPRVEPGAEIIVPKKVEKKNKMSIQETVAITTAISSITMVVVAIVNLSSK